MTVILLWLLFAVVVGFIASSMNRSGASWFFVSLIFSPIIGMVCLLFAGKVESEDTIKASEDEAKRITLDYNMVKSEFVELYASNPEFEKRQHIADLYHAVVLTPSPTQLDAMKTAIQFMK